MKNFKDLTATQKKRAVDKAFDLQSKELSKGDRGNSFKKLSAAKQKELLNGNGKFCGCYGCQTFITNILKTDQGLKEFVLGEAMVDAENAFYKEQGDTVLDVD